MQVNVLALERPPESLDKDVVLAAAPTVHADGHVIVLKHLGEKIKQAHGLTWDEFYRILGETQPGNQGRIMLPLFYPEITPKVLKSGVKRFGGLSPDDARAEVRAVAEAQAQAMSMFIHSDWTRYRPQRILVTGGGSESIGMLKVISQVFGAEVHTLDITNSAALGAATRAAYIEMHRN